MEDEKDGKEKRRAKALFPIPVSTLPAAVDSSNFPSLWHLRSSPMAHLKDEDQPCRTLPKVSACWMVLLRVTSPGSMVAAP